MENRYKTEPYETNISAASFGRLLVLCRNNGVGDERRRPWKQADLAKGIGRSVDQTRIYEQDKQPPPEDLFWGRLKPGEAETSVKGIIPFFTRENPDPDEVELLEALKGAYKNWPNGPRRIATNGKPGFKKRMYVTGILVAAGTALVAVANNLSAHFGEQAPENSKALASRVLAYPPDRDCLFWGTIISNDKSVFNVVFDYGGSPEPVHAEQVFSAIPLTDDPSEIIAARVPSEGGHMVWAESNVIEKNGTLNATPIANLSCTESLRGLLFEVSREDVFEIIPFKENR